MGRGSAGAKIVTGCGAPPQRSVLLAYLMLNGGGPPGMEILLSAALFSFLRQFQQDTGLVFGTPGIENCAAGDQQIGTRGTRPHRPRF
jgi:hypothetical protein